MIQISARIPSKGLGEGTQHTFLARSLRNFHGRPSTIWAKIKMTGYYHFSSFDGTPAIFCFQAILFGKRSHGLPPLFCETKKK